VQKTRETKKPQKRGAFKPDYLTRNTIYSIYKARKPLYRAEGGKSNSKSLTASQLSSRSRQVRKHRIQSDKGIKLREAKHRADKSTDEPAADRAGHLGHCIQSMGRTHKHQSLQLGDMGGKSQSYRLGESNCQAQWLQCLCQTKHDLPTSQRLAPGEPSQRGRSDFTRWTRIDGWVGTSLLRLDAESRQRGHGGDLRLRSTLRRVEPRHEQGRAHRRICWRNDSARSHRIGGRTSYPMV
jgi:hypothetical protein